jgi:hypothetical protein
MSSAADSAPELVSQQNAFGDLAFRSGLPLVAEEHERFGHGFDSVTPSVRVQDAVHSPAGAHQLVRSSELPRNAREMAHRERRGRIDVAGTTGRCAVEITTFVSEEVEETTFPSPNLQMVRIATIVAKPLT